MKTAEDDINEILETKLKDAKDTAETEKVAAAADTPGTQAGDVNPESTKTVEQQNDGSEDQN